MFIWPLNCYYFVQILIPGSITHLCTQPEHLHCNLCAPSGRTKLQRAPVHRVPLALWVQGVPVLLFFQHDRDFLNNQVKLLSSLLFFFFSDLSSMLILQLYWRFIIQPHLAQFIKTHKTKASVTQYLNSLLFGWHDENCLVIICPY